MTKAELVTEIALKTGLSKKEIFAVVNNAIEITKATMAGGESVYLRGFGSFITKTRAKKVARNIKKQTSIIVPEHKIPAFKPSKDFVKMYK